MIKTERPGSEKQQCRRPRLPNILSNHHLLVAKVKVANLIIMEDEHVTRVIIPLSHNKIAIGLVLLKLRFIENISIICISKYYENIFNDLSNDTNYVQQILIFCYMYLIKIKDC